MYRMASSSTSFSSRKMTVLSLALRDCSNRKNSTNASTSPAKAVFQISGRLLAMRHSPRNSERTMRQRNRAIRAISALRRTVPALHWAAKAHRNSSTSGTSAAQKKTRPHP